MDPVIGKLVKGDRGFFKKDKCVNPLDIPVIEIFAAAAADSFILAEKMVGRVAGASFSGESVADFLDFDVCQATVL